MNNIEEKDPFIESNQNIETKKKSSLPVVITILVIIIIGIGVFFYLTNSKEKIFKTNINNMFTYLTNNIEKNGKNSFVFNPKNNVVGFDGKLRVSSNIKNDEYDLTKLSKYELNYNGQLDTKNNKASFGALLNENNQEVISVYTYFYDKIMLLKSDKITNNIIKVDLDQEVNLQDLNLDKTIDYENINILLDKVKEITLNNIDSDKLFKESITENNSNLNKITYEFDLNKYINDIIIGFKDDNEVLEILSDIYNTDEDEVKELLTDSLITDNEPVIVKIELYTENITNVFKKITINVENNSTLEIIKDYDIYRFDLSVDNTSVLTGDYNTINKTTNIKVSYEGMIFSIEIKEIDDKTSSITIKYQLLTVSIEGVITTKVEDNSKIINFDFDYKDMNPLNSTYFKINNELKVSNNSELNVIDGSNAKYFEDLSYTETTEIENKLTEIFNSRYNEIVTYNPYSYYNYYDVY